MRLDLTDLSLRTGQHDESNWMLEIPPLSLGGAEYSVLVPEGVDVSVERIAGGYLVGVAFVAKVFGPCARCLGDCAQEIEVSQQEFAPTAEGGWDESSMFIEELEVDVSGLAREALVLAVPQPVLCSEDCKGICSSCGADLNKGPCGCDGLE